MAGILCEKTSNLETENQELRSVITDGRSLTTEHCTMRLHWHARLHQPAWAPQEKAHLDKAESRTA
jgi:hypothetical protein